MLQEGRVSFCGVLGLFAAEVGLPLLEAVPLKVKHSAYINCAEFFFKLGQLDDISDQFLAIFTQDLVGDYLLVEAEADFLLKEFAVVEDSIELAKPLLPEDLVVHELEVSVEAQLLLPSPEASDRLIYFEEVVLGVTVESVAVVEAVEHHHCVVTVG
jgi:hypothetical protein